MKRILLGVLPGVLGALLPLAGATGCGAGALRQSIATSDACAPGEEPCTHAGFDAPLAIGAYFEPDFHTHLPGNAGASFHYVSAAPSVLEVADDRVFGRMPGTSALMLVTDGDTVVDFLHVWVKAPTKVRLASTIPGRDKAVLTDGPIELLAGDTIFVSAMFSADGQRLMGNAPSDWVTDEKVLSILREGSDDKRRVVALAPGKTEISVSSLGLEAAIEVIVRPGRVASKGGAM
jgi:hypothetical protein